jgi:hypothetical protein
MSVVCSQSGSDLVVGNNWQVDEKAEHSAPRKFQKPTAAKHDCPVGGKVYWILIPGRFPVQKLQASRKVEV